MRVDAEMIENSLVYKGDTSKIKAVLDKARRGEDITVAFLGGSITQGFNASSHENCYAYKTYLWFKETFKDSKVKYVNAGVGATGSIIGVHRVEKQVLSENPDIVFIDFAVNDKYDKYDRIAYESLIRKLISFNENMAIVEVFMSNFDGLNVQDQQMLIGKKYNIPMISFRDAIFEKVLNGQLEWSDVSTDEVHPNDYGHHIISTLLTSFLQDFCDDSHEIKKINPALIEPLFGDKFINGTIINSASANIKEIDGFSIDEEGFQVFKNGWKYKGGEGESAKLTIEVNGKNILLLYRKTIREVAAKLNINVDNREKKKVDTYFKNGWGDYASTELLVESDKDENHVIEITIQDNDRDVEATIMGILVSR